jgi:hypothetical protein
MEETTQLSQTTTTKLGDTHLCDLSIDETLKNFLREVANDCIKVDLLCYFTRLATTGYYKLDDNWKSVSPAQPNAHQVQHLNSLPLDGYHAASFPSTQELAEALSYSEHSVRHAAQELHPCGALTYCASFGDADICYMDVKLHSSFISAALIALLQAAYYNPDALKRYLDQLEDERVDNQVGH